MAENTQTSEKKDSIFREKSLERIASPEKLNDYLRVTSPGIWLLLATVIILLAGVCIWGIFGRIRSTAVAAVVTKDGKSTCLVPADALEGVIQYHTVIVDDEERHLQPFVQEPETISESTNIYTILAGELAVGDIVYPVTLEESLAEEGIVSGKVITEIISPASLFFDR